MPLLCQKDPHCGEHLIKLFCSSVCEICLANMQYGMRKHCEFFFVCLFDIYIAKCFSREGINLVLQGMKADGLLQKLIRKWFFKTECDVVDPVSCGIKNKMHYR